MYFAVAFVVFCTVCTVLAFVRHPIFGLYFYLAATYVFPQSRWWGYMFGEMRWSLVAATVTVLAVLLHNRNQQNRPVWLTSVPARVLALYVLWMWVQLLWALDVQTHLGGTIILTKSVVAFWFVYRIVDTKERVRDVLLAHLLGCTLLGLYAYTAGRSGDRLDGVGGPGMDDAGTLGLYFATGAIVGLGLVLTQVGWRRWLSFGCVAIVMNGLILCNTRGDFVGLVAGGMVLAVFKAKAHRTVFWALAVIGMIGLASIVDEKFIERMSTIQSAVEDDEDIDASSRSRIIVIQAQLQMFRDYPLGSGHRGTEVLSSRYLAKQWLSSSGARSSHNTFMTTLVEQGFPGAVLYCWLALWTLGEILRLRRLETYHGDPELTTLAATVGAALAVILVAGNFADFLLAEVQFWLFACLVSLLHLATVRKSGEEPVASPELARQGLA